MKRLFTLLAILSLCAAAGSAAAAPVVLPDSSTFETFTLKNGLRVVCRHMPLASLTSITMAYDFGFESDPAGREGLSYALAEMQFNAAAGDVPERDRTGMASLRPAGWNLTVGPRVTRGTEVATQAQLPGVLHQFAQRARGIRLSEAAWRKAMATIKDQLRADYRDEPSRALYFQSGVLARGGDMAAIGRFASGAGLQKLTLKEAQALIAQRFVPANAVLSLAGNFGALPLQTVLEHEFGGIPAGAPMPRPAPAPMKFASQSEKSAAVTTPIGVVAIRAPALTDSLHPFFFMATVLAGSHATRRWGEPEAPLTSRFQYSIMDEPDLARFFPPLGPEADNPALLSEEFITTMREVIQNPLDPSVLRDAWRGLDWLLGGPVAPEMRGRISMDAGALSTLSVGGAVRELWGGEPFWSVYRQRFRAAAAVEFRDWLAYYGDEPHTTRVLMTPARP